jgi:flagellar motor switch protein FliG
MAYDRTDRIRRAAILVASLDDALAEQVLDGLPAGVRDRVLDEAERIDAIDPEEQQDVLAEFRRLSRATGRDAAAVEASFSDSQKNKATDGAASAETDATAGKSALSPVSPGLSDSDAAGMAELLAEEHPQIVAAALARLSEEQSAAVFAALPVDVQADALDRLADLAPADEAALEEVASQLHLQLQQKRERQARAAAGAELVQKILARTPTPQRTYLLARMAARHEAKQTEDRNKSEDRKAAPAKAASAVDPVAQQALNLAAAMRRAQAASSFEAAPLEDRSAEFEFVSDGALVAGLRSADEMTVLRALAASGEGLLARVSGMLPRRQAKQLKRMLGNLGPTRLADLHEAQRRLLELAHGAAAEEAAAA